MAESPQHNTVARRACAGSRTRLGDDTGGIVLSWLTRIAVVAGLAALVLFDAISIGTTAMNVSDQGSTAAHDASEVWLTTKNIQLTYNAAVESVAKENPGNVIATRDFKVDPDGTVHLTVSRTATTLVVFRIGPIKDWAHIERRAEGRSVDG
jgi:hypothetical protein